MKPKTFVEPRWAAAIFFGLVFLFGGAFMFFFFCVGLIENFNEVDFMLFLGLLFCMVMGICSVTFYIYYFLPKCFSLLTVSPTEIVWRCPLYRSVKMTIEQCEYIGIEDMADNNIAMPVIRGDEIAYIYLSSSPFPEKYKHKADSVRRKKGIITFAYSDKLCQALIAVIPENKTGYLVSFYNRMQVSDRMNKLNSKNKKRTSKKK